MAQNEVVKILSPLDAVELPIYLYDSSKEPWNEMSARFDGLISGITEGDIVIFSSISPRLKSRGHKYFINKFFSHALCVTMKKRWYTTEHVEVSRYSTR